MFSKIQFSRTAFALLFGLLWLVPAYAQNEDEGNVDVQVEVGNIQVPADLMMRARIVKVTPAKADDINWRWGGEGLGKTKANGTLGKQVPVGQWTEPVSVATFTKSAAPATLFLTVTVGRNRVIANATDDDEDDLLAEPKVDWASVSHDLQMEFEFSSRGQLLKTVTAAAPDGTTVGLVFPFSRLAGDKPSNDPDFLHDLVSLGEYVERRTQLLQNLPWGQGPWPRKIAVITDIGGYGMGAGYRIRHSDKAITENEARAILQLGVNGLRSTPTFLAAEAARGKEPFAALNYSKITQAMGFPVVEKSRKGAPPPEAGCPYGSKVPELTKQGVDETMQRLLKLPCEEVWALTVDEIGSVFDRTPEGKSHMAVCERCQAAYREFLKARGVSPQDFGKKTWDEVRPVDIWDKKAPAPNLSDPVVGMGIYYTGLFNNYSTAKLFTPLRDAIAQANARKSAALKDGKKDSPEAKQPWIYSYALRGNTFLLGGHSLDFFDFYRLADNGFVYETSNRDPRIWGWDSYLCDVGRVIGKEQNLKQGIYIKPHRGAPFQRALSAVSRGSQMLYWYTYGPNYAKGDSFSGNPKALEATSKIAQLLGKTENALYGAQWARPAEVAIVKPFLLEIWRTSLGLDAAWEDTKWTYSALQHAHIPVDPIDDEILARGNLAQYKVIYIPSPNLTRAAAAKVADWVKAGGTLVTNAAGLSHDEANQPLNVLAPVLGLGKRQAAEQWFPVQRYTSTQIQNYPGSKTHPVIPEGAVVSAGQVFDPAPLKLGIGREILTPAAGTEALARFADGGIAATRHKVGNGFAYVLGFYPGLEYSLPLRTDDYDMETGLSAATRSFITAPALAAGVSPVVAPSAPTVEGVLLTNPTNGMRSVTLMNWGYRVVGEKTRNNRRVGSVTELIPRRNLQVAVRGAGVVKEVRSAMSGAILPFTVAGDTLTVTIPELQEGDVLLLN